MIPGFATPIFKALLQIYLPLCQLQIDGVLLVVTR